MNEKIKQYLKENLSEEKYIHSLGVEKTAKELAKMFNNNEEKCGLAGLLHDIAKSLPSEQLIELIDKKNIEVIEEEKKSLKTLHSPVGAYLAKKIFNIEDDEILNAIRYHTIGHENMSDMEKIVFLADKIEPETRPLEFRKLVLEELEKTKDLNSGLIICYGSTIKSLVDRKMYINFQTINVWNKLVK